MQIVLVIFFTLIFFLTMILLLASKPKYAGKITRICIAIAGIGGLFFYGYGFASSISDPALATVRALLAVCGIYMGRTDFSAVSGTPLMEHPFMPILFWTVHLVALYATTSAAITTVGAEALRKLRLWLARRGSLHLIYGVSDDTLSLGKQLLEQKRGSVVFVDEKADSANANAIAQAGCVLRSDESALQAERGFLKAIGALRKGRSIHVYAMEKLASDNLNYARKLLKTLEANTVAPEQTSLVLRAHEDASAAKLQVLGDRYGYGSVTAVHEASLAARTLIQAFPPCNYIDFDETGKATDDLEVLIVGFGQIGQNVLRQLVMNGQFEGSHFRATVFAPDHSSVKGYFSKNYGQVLERYDIRFRGCDARSEQFYEHLAQRGEMLKYIAICTGEDAMDLEIAEDLAEHLQTVGWQIPIFRCGHRGVQHFNAADRSGELFSLYRPETLSIREQDQLAMLVNSHYQDDQEKTPWEHWRECDPFSRMSCRATADFAPAMLRMAGLTEDQVQGSGWDLTDAQLEVMSQTEHLRWCAFHFCMGYSPMTPEEYDEREATYLRQVAAGEAPLRVGKNKVARTHACLIDWDALDALSQWESRVTGKPIDYKDLDRDNVRLIPELLQTRRKAKV